MPANFDLERLRGAAQAAKPGDDLVTLTETAGGWVINWSGQTLRQATSPEPKTFSSSDSALRYLVRNVIRHTGKPLRCCLVLSPSAPLV